MPHVVVASTSEIKLVSTQNTFHRIFPGEMFTFEGVKAESGVPSQPMSDEQTLQGALNRIAEAQKIKPDADFWVGLEGGVEPAHNTLRAFAWMVVKSKSGVIGKGKTGTFYLPPPVVALIKQGLDLGEADDKIFGRHNSKNTNGAIGLLTNDHIDRIKLYEHAMTMALIPFLQPQFYN